MNEKINVDEWFINLPVEISDLKEFIREKLKGVTDNVVLCGNFLPVVIQIGAGNYTKGECIVLPNYIESITYPIYQEIIDGIYKLGCIPKVETKKDGWYTYPRASLIIHRNMSYEQRLNFNFASGAFLYMAREDEIEDIIERNI